MNTEELKDLVHLYFDGELEKSKEALLFTSLSRNEDAREYFKSMNLLRKTIHKTESELPRDLEERILRSVGKASVKLPGFFTGQRILSSVSLGIVLLLIILSGYLFMKVSAYEERIEGISNHVILQSKTIRMLYNSLPGIEIRASFDDEIVVKPNI
jgi:hypothetical protein